MDTILWEINFFSPPKTRRYCKKCANKTEHVSSGLFRVNAQKMSLDIWLIYRCGHCKATWNLTIYSRVHPKCIGQDLLRKFMHNDSELAWQYAMDADLLKKNGGETETPPYSILGNDVDPTRETRVKIINRYPFKISVSKLVREKLSLTKKSFEAMVADGTIRLENGADIQKCNLKNGTVVCLFSNIALYGRIKNAKNKDT